MPGRHRAWVSQAVHELGAVGRPALQLPLGMGAGALFLRRLCWGEGTRKSSPNDGDYRHCDDFKNTEGSLLHVDFLCGELITINTETRSRPPLCRWFGSGCPNLLLLNSDGCGALTQCVQHKALLQF